MSDLTTYPHALASLALGANVALAAAALVPVPGFTGWALVLAIVDGAGSPVDQRVRRAARVAQGIAFPLFVLVGIGAASIGDPMLMVTGFLLALFAWTRTDLAVGHDLIGQFLAGHVAGDVARPAMSHAEADELVGDVATRLTDATLVTLIETSGALVGAIGPRQLAGRDRRRAGQRCSEIMVSISNAPLLPASTPASALRAALRQHGFALIRVSGGLAYVEVADLLERIQAGPDGAGHSSSDRPSDDARSGFL